MKKNELTVDLIQKICKGKIISRGIERTVCKFCNDTRELQENDMFLSIKPESGDGIPYIIEAFEKGAIGCITEYELTSEIIEKYKNKIIIQVKDTLQALIELAKYKRNLYNIPVIAITGSVGKTTTKEMIAKVLEQKYHIAKSKKSYNNRIGLPLTILDWDDDIETAVVEMGMNHLGEIRELTNIAKPTIAVITNVGTAHIGFLGSRENILKAKLEILEGLPNSGKVVFNNDNDMLHNTQIENYETITFGIENKSDYIATNIKISEEETNYKLHIRESEYKISIQASGQHYVYDSLCAIAVGDILNVDAEKMAFAIKNFKNTGKRNEINNINNIIMINDYFNANFDSVKAALEVLYKITAKRKVAILGDMRELGEYGEELHRNIGKEIINKKIDVLVTVGEIAKFIADEAKKLGLKEIYVFNNNSDCIKKLRQIIKKGDAVLIKASKVMHFEEIAESIEKGGIYE